RSSWTLPKTFGSRVAGDGPDRDPPTGRPPGPDRRLRGRDFRADRSTFEQYAPEHPARAGALPSREAFGRSFAPSASGAAPEALRSGARSLPRVEVTVSFLEPIHSRQRHHPELPQDERIVEGGLAQSIIASALPAVAGRVHVDVKD